MNPIGKALWYMESHYRREITLDEIADASGVTRFHLRRVFRLVTGHSPLGYVRERRLSDAARQSAAVIASGAPNILDVALNACYASHEAFTRAFRDRFGSTPEEVRAHGNLSALNLMEPLRMNTIESTQNRSDPHAGGARPAHCGYNRALHGGSERRDSIPMAAFRSLHWPHSRAERRGSLRSHLVPRNRRNGLHRGVEVRSTAADFNSAYRGRRSRPVLCGLHASGPRHRYWADLRGDLERLVSAFQSQARQRTHVRVVRFPLQSDDG